MKRFCTVMTLLVCCGSAAAFEPVSAFHDGFAIPGVYGGSGAVYSFPGWEAFGRGVTLAGGWFMPHGMEELSTTTGCASYGWERVGLSASFSGTGFDLYGDEMAKAGIAFRPVSWIAGGIRLTRCAMRIEGYGSASAMGADTGFVVRPREGIFVSAAYEDITGAELGRSEEPVDGRMLASFCWRAAPGASLVASVSKVRRFDPSMSAGIITEILDSLTLGIIGANGPDRFEFLCGVSPGRSRFSWRGTYHRELGMTHGFSISWRDSRDGGQQ